MHSVLSTVQHGSEGLTAAPRVAQSVEPLLQEIFAERLPIREPRLSTYSRAELRHVLSAVGADIRTLLKTAVRCSIVVSARRSKLASRLAHHRWLVVEAMLPAFLHPAEMDDEQFPYRVTDEQDICAARDSLVRALSTYIEALVAGGFLGLVIYRDGQTGAYSYILRRSSASWWTLVYGLTKHIVKISEDPRARLGQRTTYADLRSAIGRVWHVTEEHVHHLRGMSVVSFDAFQGSWPPWVSVLREEVGQLPWVQRHLRVITGTIVGEEVYQRDEQTQILRHLVVKTWKDSPAITFGDLCLAGWSSDDLPSEESL